MKILLDADSCPKEARELVLRRSEKLNLTIIFAANRPIPRASSRDVVMEVCDSRENSADDRIVELAEAGDLVISRDIPLAKRLVEKNISVIDDRGRVFTKENINEALSVRNFIVSLSENGLGAARQRNYGKKELKTFADSLERILSRRP